MSGNKTDTAKLSGIIGILRCLKTLTDNINLMMEGLAYGKGRKACPGIYGVSPN
jgi:hypothetical protein